MNAWRAAEAAISGALIGAGLLGLIGATGGHAVHGAIAGLLLGGIIGTGAYTGHVHRVTVGAILYALLACCIGPGVDDYGGAAAVPFALIGAFAGWLGWRFLLAIPGVIAGGFLAAWLAPPYQSPGWLYTGLCTGPLIAVYVGAKLERHFGATGRANLADLMPAPQSDSR